MDADLIRRWNEKVKPEDEVWHLGDFGFGRMATAAYLEPIFNKLNGKKHIVWGNHDREAKKFAHLFASTHDFKEIVVNKQEIVLCHYALRSWHHNIRGTWHLFGHTHNSLPPFGKSFDCGVDTNDYYVYSFDDIKAKMATLKVTVQEGNFKCKDCRAFPCVCG